MNISLSAFTPENLVSRDGLLCIPPSVHHMKSWQNERANYGRPDTLQFYTWHEPGRCTRPPRYKTPPLFRVELPLFHLPRTIPRRNWDCSQPWNEKKGEKKKYDKKGDGEEKNARKNRADKERGRGGEVD